MSTSETGWTTHAEIAFIDRLADGKNAIAKLRGYIAAMSQRADFGAMNADEVLSYAREKLALLERRAV